MDHFFFKRNSVNSFISICLSDLKDQKLPVSAIKTQIEDNRPKILLVKAACLQQLWHESGNLDVY